MIDLISVKNFRTLQNVTIQLGPQNVFVGPNMAGKSNLIDVFRFLNDVLFPKNHVAGLWHAFTERGGFTDVIWKGSQSSLISISLTGHTKDKKIFLYAIEILGSERGSVSIVKEELKVAKDQSHVDLIRILPHQKELVNSDGRIVSGVSDTARSCLEFEIPGWEGNFLRSLIAEMRFYDLIPSLARTQNPSASTAFLTEHGENLSTWLMNLQTQYRDEFAVFRQAALDALPELSDLFTVPTQQATVFASSREKHLKNPVSIFQMSDGQICFLALLSLFTAPPSLSGSIYFIEELETHLHPKLVEILVDLLKQKQPTWIDNGGPQIIMTTHSPIVVDKFSVDELFVFERREGATICTRPRDTKHLVELLQDESVSLGDLYYSGALSRAK